MKVRIGVDSRHMIIRSVSATAAIIHGFTEIPLLSHGQEHRACTESAHQRRRDFIREQARHLQDLQQRRVRIAGRVDSILQRNRQKLRIRPGLEFLRPVIERISEFPGSAADASPMTPIGCAPRRPANFSPLRQSLLRLATQQRTACQ